MVRSVKVGLVALSLVVPALVMVGSAAAATPPIQLLVPQGTAFSVLGYDCGGIGENAYATGFDSSLDPLAGYPTGDVFLTTTCSAGKGTHFTVTAWTSDTWDLTGALLSHSVLSGAPTVDPTFTATDPPTSNQVYNTTNFKCSSSSGAVPSACLQLAPTFTPRPRVTGISSTQGPATGGTSVTISGDGFTAATQVYFGTTLAVSPTINSDTSITAVAPADTSGTSPDTVDVTVVSPGGTSFTSSSDQFTFYGQPSVTGVSPSSGPMSGGYYVTVTGTNFVGTTGVKDGDTPTAFQVIDNTTLSVYIVPGETAGDQMDITVTSPGGTSPVTPADQFTYGSSGCTGSCTSSVSCAKVTGTVTGLMKLSLCTPASATNRTASTAALGSTLTWVTSRQTTVESLSSSSPGQGLCPLNSTELDISGVVTGGTSTYTAIGDAVSASLCENRSGHLSLVTGTKYSL